MPGSAALVVWKAESERGAYIAVFNLGEKPQRVHYSWKDLEVPDGNHAIRDLWARKDLGSATSLETHLAAHAAMLFRIE